jgi:hypothetical protein
MNNIPSEWTFEQARKHWRPMTRAVQHVGVPGYQFQPAVMWDGALVFGPLGYLNLKVMQQELAPLGRHFLHLAVGYGQSMRFVDRTGAGNPDIRRSLEEGHLPIPRVETKDGDLAWRETVFAHLLDHPLDRGMQIQPDDVLVVHAGFQVRNTGLMKQTGHLWLHFGDTSQVRFGYKCQVGFKTDRGTDDLSLADGIAPAIPHRYEQPFGIVDDKIRYVLPQPAKGTLRWHAEVPAPAGIRSAPQKVIEWEVPLAPDEEAELRLVIPFGLVERSMGRRLAKLDAAALLEEVRQFWKKLQYGPGRIATPDPFINDYLAAVPGQMAQQVGQRVRSTRAWMYKTSPNHYESYWPCNAAKALPTFDMRGLTGLSRPVLRSFIDFQTDDVRGMDKGIMGQDQGLKGEGFTKVHGFLGNFGEWTANPLLLSHGLELWALASHYRITRDAKWLGKGRGSPLQAILDACNWLAVQRRRTMREENGKKVPYWGLLPAASAHDWLMGNTIFNDAFCIYGMIETVRMLREIRHPMAESIAKELSDYRAALRGRYREARDQARPLPLPDGSTIPFVPRIVQELDWAQPDWTYTSYGPLRAGAWGALDPDDELVNQALAFIKAGLPKGEGFYDSGFRGRTAEDNWRPIDDKNADRHYLWRHYVEYETMWPIGPDLFLQRDDLPCFFEWLYHNLAVVLHHDWRVGVESLNGVPSCAPGDAERWRAIRNMFVNERGGYDGSQQSLFLLQALPREWLKPGNRLAAREIGTHFGGRVDLAIHVAEDGNSVSVCAGIGLAVLPTEIRMRLRSGDGRPLLSAKVNGRRIKVGKDATLLLPLKKKGNYRVEGFF